MLQRTQSRSGELTGSEARMRSTTANASSSNYLDGLRTLSCAIPRFLNQAVILKINLACVCREIGIAARCAR
jgi:hypothetical protein